MSDEPKVHERPRQSVLRSDTIVAFDRWQTPELKPDPQQGATSPGVLVTQLEALQKQAYEEAYATGLRDGRAAGAAEPHAEALRFSALIEKLARPFEALDDSVEKQLIQLAMIVARHIIRRELKTDPSHVIGAVREALAVLPAGARDVCVTLHPDDAALVRKFLKPVEGERAWKLEEDPILTRGGCQVDSEFSHIDARIEAQLSALVAAMVGDEREPANTPPTISDR